MKMKLKQTYFVDYLFEGKNNVIFVAVDKDMPIDKIQESVHKYLSNETKKSVTYSDFQVLRIEKESRTVLVL